MPTYDYECIRCNHRFERFQSMSDPHVKTCPECRGKVRRLIGSGAGIIFKGQGFYITDYRSKDYRDQAGKDKPPADKPPTDKPSADKASTDKPVDSGGGAKPESAESSKKSDKPAKPAGRKKSGGSKKP